MSTFARADVVKDRAAHEPCPACHYVHAVASAEDWRPVMCSSGPLAGKVLNYAREPHCSLPGGEYVFDAGLARYVWREGW